MGVHELHFTLLCCIACTACRGASGENVHVHARDGVVAELHPARSRTMCWLLQSAVLVHGQCVGVKPLSAAHYAVLCCACDAGKQKKRRRGGERARVKKIRAARQEAKQAQHEKQAELERQTGSEGVFAVLNQLVGDGLGAHGAVRGWAGERSGAVPGGVVRHNEQQQQAKQQGQRGEAVAAAGDRQRLVNQQTEMTALTQKVAQLRDMERRNARDGRMLPQIRQALAVAEQQLKAAADTHARSNAAVHEKERNKRWSKF
jgi:hypothetical protein